MPPGIALIMVVLLFLSTGCVFVEITMPKEGKPESLLEVYPGFVFVNLEGQDEGVSVLKTQGVGLIGGHGHLSLGWLHETIIQAPDASHCRVVILADELQIKNILSLLKNANVDLGTICTTS